LQHTQWSRARPAGSGKVWVLLQWHYPLLLLLLLLLQVLQH
jgi:hypothetical protein